MSKIILSACILLLTLSACDHKADTYVAPSKPAPALRLTRANHYDANDKLVRYTTYQVDKQGMLLSYSDYGANDELLHKHSVKSRDIKGRITEMADSAGSFINTWIYKYGDGMLPAQRTQNNYQGQHESYYTYTNSKLTKAAHYNESNELIVRYLFTYDASKVKVRLDSSVLTSSSDTYITLDGMKNPYATFGDDYHVFESPHLLGQNPITSRVDVPWMQPQYFANTYNTDGYLEFTATTELFDKPISIRYIYK